jgi:hypothetical protein
MKRFLLLGLIFLSSFTLSAQCFEYRSEMQNIENYIVAAQRNLKKAQKTNTLEEAQQFIDKSISQAAIAIRTASFAKEYAESCNCETGANGSITILTAISDFKSLCQKTVDSSTIEKLHEALKDNLLLGESVLNEISEAASLCLENTSD